MPDNSEINRKFQALFDAHDDAFRALRVANTQIGSANTAMGRAIQAHDEAIQAAIDANRAALALLKDLPGGLRE
jgi:hypothetical protein